MQINLVVDKFYNWNNNWNIKLLKMSACKLFYLWLCLGCLLALASAQPPISELLLRICYPSNCNPFPNPYSATRLSTQWGVSAVRSQLPDGVRHLGSALSNKAHSVPRWLLLRRGLCPQRGWLVHTPGSVPQKWLLCHLSTANKMTKDWKNIDKQLLSFFKLQPNVILAHDEF